MIIFFTENDMLKFGSFTSGLTKALIESGEKTHEITQKDMQLWMMDQSIEDDE